MDILVVGQTVELACIVTGVVFITVLVICVVIDSRGN